MGRRTRPQSHSQARTVTAVHGDPILPPRNSYIGHTTQSNIKPHPHPTSEQLHYGCTRAITAFLTTVRANKVGSISGGHRGGRDGGESYGAGRGTI
eukprot:5722879-Amphidinium_carterae.1